MKVETWLQGCGLAILLTLNTLWVHISPKRADLYHSLLPVNHIYWGLVVDWRSFACWQRLSCFL
jgi:hypothetical protein